MPTDFHVVQGCLHATKAELSSGTIQNTKLARSNICPSIEKVCRPCGKETAIGQGQSMEDTDLGSDRFSHPLTTLESEVSPLSFYFLPENMENKTAHFAERYEDEISYKVEKMAIFVQSQALLCPRSHLHP